VSKIDPGEALLIDYACENLESMILTGDKRCILALAAEPACAEIVALLKGRFWHFDCILEHLAVNFGWGNIRGRVCDDAAADSGLAAALELAHHETTAKANLSARIQSLIGDTAGLLFLP